MLTPVFHRVMQMSQKKSVLRRNGFTFKQFFVAHDRCAMKVGTDGVLLGSWAPLANVKRILDIGTGSGLIALMLAQRTGIVVQVDAVELDTDAAQQAKDNAQASPWAARINVYQDDVINWAAECDRHYQLIVSNPPYFAPGVACASSAREKARYTGHLDHEALLICAGRLLSDEGFLAVILPENSAEQLIAMAKCRGLHLRLRTDVAEKENKLPTRVMLAFSPCAGNTFSDRLIIRDSNNHYSTAWRGLTQDFYLLS
ncbi:tRNA1Val (adenine37-N6)-methyltransferase [Izhakiella capsodis]|uniref:tRNA1(Val) (adenine(37)-N6)-methyltransferase n=2 Tax=Izhakiella capsodis TaxID=1367852 RepID=A0A1I4WBK7_9GAMM|nr:tRNA1Val (adenine37-N6)-methyltransferase [Izhakiella capsodis]